MTYAIFIWHNVFLAITMSMIDLNTVFPALITALGGSKITFGLLYSIILGAPYLFNIVFGHFLAAHPYRRKFLLLGIYLRAASFLGMAGFTYLLGREHPQAVVASFFIWVFIFSTSSGFAGISYSDIIGKLVEKGKRGKFYAAKQFAASVASFLGGLIVARAFSLKSLTFPANYALLLAIGAGGLLIASAAFWLIREPPSAVEERPSLRSRLGEVPGILREHRSFLRFIVVENMSSFSLMLMPFYMIYAKEALGVADRYIGIYLLFQIGGTIASNLIWGLISQRFGSRSVVRACLLLGALIPLLALGISPLGANIFSIVFLLLGFVRSGRQVGFEPYLLDILPEDERPVYLGIRGTLNVFIVVLPFLGGVLINAAGYPPVFVLVAGVMLTTFFLLGGKRDKKAAAG